MSFEYDYANATQAEQPQELRTVPFVRYKRDTGDIVQHGHIREDLIATIDAGDLPFAVGDGRPETHHVVDGQVVLKVTA